MDQYGGRPQIFFIINYPSGSIDKPIFEIFFMQNERLITNCHVPAEIK